MKTTHTAADIQAQLSIATRISNPSDLFAHVGYLRATPRSRPGNLGIRFYTTRDLIGERMEDGYLWESVAVAGRAA